jgi:ADP-ribose pyrophosphatase YjhB (NUDIX family)
MQAGQIRTIVLGIFQYEGRLLVFEGYDPMDGLTFYRPLGGGIEFGEYGDQALIREMCEEIGAEVVNVRYLATLQNIFTHNGRMGHEIVLLYAADFADPSMYESGAFARANDNGQPISVMWKPLADFAAGAFLVPIGLLELLTHGSPA